jgi:hypothetical protein
MSENEVIVDVCEDDEEVTIGQQIAIGAIVAVFAIGVGTIVTKTYEFGEKLWLIHKLKQAEKCVTEMYDVSGDMPFKVLDGGQESE